MEGRKPPQDRGQARGGRASRDLEQILDAIASGSVASGADLDQTEIETLRSAYGREDDLETLLDQLRGPAADEI